jgi:DNA-binding transcriptional ArsR family regulator
MEKKSIIGTLAIRHPLRVALLRALSDGEEVNPTTYAESWDLPEKSVNYHLNVLVDAGAVELADGQPRITNEGKALYELSLRSERRRARDRRERPRRQGDWDE